MNPRQSEKLSSLPHGTMFGCKNEEVIDPSTMVWNVMEAGQCVAMLESLQEDGPEKPEGLEEPFEEAVKVKTGLW